jgi:cytidyltransferase-like protein
MSNEEGNQIIVAVSGGFDPLHVGHIRMFREARALGDSLVVILNNDNWLRRKKGTVFMPEDQRKEVIEALQDVDRVMVTSHSEDAQDMSVSKELQELKPDIFVNGGDRQQDNIPETVICDGMGCRMVFNIGHGGKVQSSSWLLTEYVNALPCFCGSREKYGECHGKAT